MIQAAKHLCGNLIMRTIVKGFSALLMSVFVLSMRGIYAEEHTFFGLWRTTQYGEFENVEICITDSMISYSREGGKFEENHSTSFENFDRVDNVVLISFYHGKALMRKFVMVKRSQRQELVGQLHLYDGYQNYNYLPVYLKKSAASCSEISK